LLLGYEIFPFVRERRLAFQVVEEPLADLDHAHVYILRDALARRILSPIAESYLRGYQYAADKQPRGGDRKSAHRIRGRGKTAEALAEAFGVSAATIERDAQITLAVHALMASCGAEVKRLLLNVEYQLRVGRPDRSGGLAAGALARRDQIACRIMKRTLMGAKGR
jgi:hypothetical protein